MLPKIDTAIDKTPLKTMEDAKITSATLYFSPLDHPWEIKQYEQFMEDIATIVAKHKVRAFILSKNWDILPITPIKSTPNIKEIKL
jgi:hypothetical protein